MKAEEHDREIALETEWSLPEGGWAMKQKKHIWKTFSAWEADAFRQYLEALALDGWYPESIGNMGIDCYRGEPEKRRYAVMIAPGISSLTGTDSWTADRFREQCEEAGWKFQCSGNLWQIFYTTDDSLELTEEMSDAAQFKTQKALVFNWSVMLLYPLISVLECWLVCEYFKDPGATFSDPGKLFSLAISVVLLISYTWAYIQLAHWKRQSEQGLKKSGKLPVVDLEKVLVRKRYERIFLIITLSAAVAAVISFVLVEILFFPGAQFPSGNYPTELCVLSEKEFRWYDLESERKHMEEISGDRIEMELGVTDIRY